MSYGVPNPRPLETAERNLAVGGLSKVIYSLPVTALLEYIVCVLDGLLQHSRDDSSYKFGSVNQVP